MLERSFALLAVRQAVRAVRLRCRRRLHQRAVCCPDYATTDHATADYAAADDTAADYAGAHHSASDYAGSDHVAADYAGTHAAGTGSHQRAVRQLR